MFHKRGTKSEGPKIRAFRASKLCPRKHGKSVPIGRRITSDASPKTLSQRMSLISATNVLRNHRAGLSPYTANLCPLSTRVELASFREDFGESIDELVETMFWGAIRQRATEHLDGMLSEQQGIHDAVETAARRETGSFRLRREVPRLRSSQMKFSLQIGTNNVDVAHRHLGINVAE